MSTELRVLRGGGESWGEEMHWGEDRFARKSIKRSMVGGFEVELRYTGEQIGPSPSLESSVAGGLGKCFGCVHFSVSCGSMGCAITGINGTRMF